MTTELSIVLVLVMQDSQTSYLLKAENQPECQACQSRLTVKHILIDCIHLSAVRRRYFRVNSVKELFEIVDSRNIMLLLEI